MQPILFLDIDGVCNSRPFMEQVLEDYPEYSPWSNKPGPSLKARLDPGCIRQLNRLAGKVRLVLTSRWGLRYDLPEMKAAFKAAGWSGGIHDQTEKKMSSAKSSEISVYLRYKCGGARGGYAILDSSDLSQLRNVVRTDDQVGVTEANIEAVAALLGLTL